MDLVCVLCVYCIAFFSKAWHTVQKLVFKKFSKRHFLFSWYVHFCRKILSLRFTHFSANFCGLKKGLYSSIVFLFWCISINPLGNSRRHCYKIYIEIFIEVLDAQTNAIPRYSNLEIHQTWKSLGMPLYLRFRFQSFKDVLKMKYFIFQAYFLLELQYLNLNK